MTMFTHTAAFVALTAAVTAAGQFGFSLYDDWTSPPPARSLSLISIDYRDGMIRQHIEPEGADAIVATWAAKITRGGRNLCSGGDRSTYTGKPFEATPSRWTKDQCPEIQPGDMGVATWEWQDADGHVRSTSVEFELLPAVKRAGD